MEVRKRQNISNMSGSGDAGEFRSGSPESKGAKIDRSFTHCIILSFLIVISALVIPLFFVSHLPEFMRQPAQKMFEAFGLESKAHAVVIDAGSTGSRVLAFTFKRDLDHSLVLEDELWMQVKPGLSSYADEPLKAGQSLQELLNAAKVRIPEKYWSKTPIALKATAGLRLLPKEKSEAIINEVQKVLETSGFKPDKNKLIEIMNPMEEGLYAWFTVNYLLGSFETKKKVWNSAACLDLGGGSTQITFSPKKFPVAGIEGRKHFVHKVDILEGNPINVYSHSYLGLGLMAAREAIFVQEGAEASEADKISTSSCVTSKSPLTFSFHGKTYKVTKNSESNTNSNYDSCLKIVRKVISDNNVHTPEEMIGRDIAAFSYFYDLAMDAGLIPEGRMDGAILIEDYQKAAQKACASESSEFACVDLTFLYGLLNHGYGLPNAKQLNLYKKIHGHEASWALGVGYQMIHHQ